MVVVCSDLCGGRGGSAGGDSFRNCSSCGRHTFSITKFGAVRNTSSASCGFSFVYRNVYDI